jgi:nucleoside-diphosphate-sugar epimerase
MKFAVTGSSGFIGQSLCRLLSHRNYDFLSLSRRSPGVASPYCPDSRYVDYANRLELENTLRGCDYVIHLAGLAHKYLRPSDNPSQIYKAANVDPLVNLALASAEVNVKKFIYISSIGVLGSPTPGVPFTDETIPDPELYYSKSKLAGEVSLRSICAKSPMSFVILRPPLVYGPNCPGNLARLIKLIQFLPILPFGSLSGGRSFLSVDHLVDMIIRSAHSTEIINSAYVLSDSVDL